MTITKIALLFIFSNEKNLRRIWLIFDIEKDFESQNFAVFDLQFENDQKAKNIFMVVFVVL